MIFVLTGAGLSAESGLGTFRDEGGLWTQYDLSEVATPEGFAADPEKVLSFYNARRANAAGATPNAAHHALARLSKEASTTLVTQNVDSLLEAAGALNVIHMHGQLNRALCHVCGARWDAPDVMAVTDLCPACAAPATRPDVVWFGEMPYHMEAIEDAMTQADLFVAIGTSGTVYPAAGFVEMARSLGIETLELNLEPSGGRFDDGRYGPATQIVPEWVSSVVAT